MRVTVFRRVGLTLLALILAVPALEARQKALSAADAWIRLPAAGATTTTAFAIIDNPTMYDVYVTGVTTDAAAEVRFRAPDTTAAAPKELSAPAYGTLELTPAGVHLELVGLTRPLTAGEPVTLTFTTDAGAVVATAVVK